MRRWEDEKTRRERANRKRMPSKTGVSKWEVGCEKWEVGEGCKAL